MSDEIKHCPLSGYKCNIERNSNGDLFINFDLYHGSPDEFSQTGYWITAKALKDYHFEDLNKWHVWHFIAEWLYYHQNVSSPYDIITLCADDEKDDSKNYFSIGDMLKMRILPSEIPEKLLRFIYSNSKTYSLFPLKEFYINDLDAVIDILGIGSFDELKMLLEYLEQKEYIKLTFERREIKGTKNFNEIINARFTPKGLEYYKDYIGDSNMGFVAMKFGKSPQWTDKNGKIYEEGERDLDEFYDDFIAPAITQAGFEPVRIDRTLHNKKIDDEILVQIRKSKFVVCDLTYENLGAYYEGGFAQGLGKEVFFICEKEFFDSHPPHFDLNHHVTTLYERGKEEEFIRELAARIENNVIRI